MNKHSILKMSRRDFLKLSGAVAGTALLSKYGTKFLAETEPKRIDESVNFVANICTMCSTLCDIIVAYKEVNGKKVAIKIEGDPKSGYNRGKICARGQSGLRRVYSPNRLKKPLVRVEGSSKGEWAFVEKTWDEALGYIKTKIQELTGGDFSKIAFVSGWADCTSYRPFAFSFLKAAGIKYFVATPMQNCVMGAHLGVDSVIGTFNCHAESLPDYDNSDYILALRANASIAGVSVPRGERFAEAIKNGAKVVVLDPRMSETASLATEWIPIKPGTDPAFLLAMLNVIVNEGLYREDFVKYYTNAPFLAYYDETLGIPVLYEDGDGNFIVYDETAESIVTVPRESNSNYKDIEGNDITPALEVPSGTTYDGKEVKTVLQWLKDALANYTPEWAETITDVSKETITRIAREFANAERPTVDYGWYGSRYENSYMTNKLRALLQIFVAGIDREGGWIYSAKGRLGLMKWNMGGATRDPTQAPLPGILFFYYMLKGGPWQAPDDMKPPAIFPLASDLVLYKMVQAGQVKVVYISASNPLRSMYDSEKWKYILENTFVIVADIQVSDTQTYADVILPELAYLERIDAPMPTESQSIEFAARFPASSPVSEEAEHTLTTMAKMLDVLMEIKGGNPNYRVAWYNMIKWMFGVAVDPEESAMFDEMITNANLEPEEVPNKLQEFFAWMFLGHRLKVCEKLGLQNCEPTEFISTVLNILRKGSFEVIPRETLLESKNIPRNLQFSTPSGRAEIYSYIIYDAYKTFFTKMNSENWDKNALHPLVAFPEPKWKEGMASTDKPEGNEFFVAHGKTPLMSFTSTANNDLLLSLNTIEKRFMWVWIHPNRANVLGINTGDRIKITETKTGKSVEARAYVTDMIREDTIFIPFGWVGKSSVLDNYKDFYDKFGPLPSYNELTPFQFDRLVTGFKTDEFTVTVEKI